MATTSTTRAPHTPPGPGDIRGTRPFAALCVLTSAAIFAQAVIAGLFVGHEDEDGWVTVHGVVADVSWVLALAAAVCGVVRLRRGARRLVVASVALFALTLAQTGIGHLITDLGHDGLIVVHVPLAVAIFGLTVWVTSAALRLDRTGAASSGRPRRSS
jgi:hypothetical protein